MYMNMNPAAFLYLSPLECCSAYFGWTYGSCVEAALSAITRFANTDFSNAHTLEFEGTIELGAATCAGIPTPTSADSAGMIMANATFAELCKDFCKPGDSITVTSVCGEATTAGANIFTFEGRNVRHLRHLQSANAFHYLLTVRTPTEDDAGILLKILNSQLALPATLTAMQGHIQAWGFPTATITGYTQLNFFIKNSAGTIVRQKVYYPDWGNTETCIADGNEPEYMRNNPTAWVFNTADACCTRYFSWSKETCLAGANSTSTSGTRNATNLWFPDWESGGSVKCIQDTNTTTPPEYIAANPNSWMRTTSTDCCERYFGWDTNNCLHSSGGANATAAGSSDWYVNWADFQCVKDCVASTTDLNCGGLKQRWDEGFNTANTCCTAKLSWKSTTICTPTGAP